jgi:signal peptidase I
LANTFTGLQTINGNLKADFVLVNNTTPVLTSHLTSKFYVDTALNTKQNTVTSGDNITIKNNIISSIGGITQDELDLKQDLLTRYSHLNINSLSISSESLSLNTIVPGQVKSDTLETGNIKCTSLELNGDLH